MRIKLFVLAALTLTVAGCDREGNRQGPLEGGVQAGYVMSSVEDAERMTVFDYDYYTMLTSGPYVYLPEIAADFFNPSIDYGNRNGAQYRWDWNSGDPFVDIWFDAYSAIRHACLGIESIGGMDKSGFDEDEMERLDKCLGVFYFTKAYFGLRLLNYYCPIYNSGNKEKYGIVLIDSSDDDTDTFGGRSSVEKSYAWVKDNAEKAAGYLAAFEGKAGSEELTIDVVRAFQARLALEMGNYNEAISLSMALVESNKYPLCENQTDMDSMWVNDSGKECILQLPANERDLQSNDPGYVGYKPSKGHYTPDWIVNKWVAKDLYASSDLRFATWFKKVKITVSLGTASGIVIMDKFPGNPALSASKTAHLSKIKPFRIAEQYLIAAEAFARKGGADVIACAYLDKLLEKRNPNHASLSLTGSELMEYIKDERAREFIGEGFRWNDLKRWGEGMQRPNPQFAAIIHTGGSNGPALSLSVAPSDHRWVAPIPVDELVSNPQIRDQQNPGY